MSDSVTALSDHRRGQDSFAGVLANTKVEQMDEATPCADWRVRDLIAHVVGGNQRTAGIAAPPPVPPAELIEAYRDSAAGAQQAFEAADGLTKTFQVPFGTVPGSVFIGLRTVDVLTHAWDLAKATGQPTDLDPELAERLLALFADRIGPELRGVGRPFADPQPCAQSRPAADRLAAFLGRSLG
jgi:uncharacterized protein (TIGR03086 family)